MRTSTSAQDSPARPRLAIFTDPGVDDVFAADLFRRAAIESHIEIAMVIGHYGNTSAENATRHARGAYCWDLAVPIFRGAAHSSCRPHPFLGDEPQGYFDPNGLCGLEFPESTAATGSDWRDHLVSELQGEQSLELVVLGPATDAADFLRSHSELAKKSIRGITVMGGSFGYGLAGPKMLAEFNVYLDVPSYCALLAAANSLDIPVTVVSWDEPVLIWKDQLEALRPTDERSALLHAILTRYFEQYPQGDAAIPGDAQWQGRDLEKDVFCRLSDAKAVMAIVYPELSDFSPLEFIVVSDKDLPEHYGQTIESSQVAQTLASHACFEGPFRARLARPRHGGLAMRVLLRAAGFRHSG